VENSAVLADGRIKLHLRLLQSEAMQAQWPDPSELQMMIYVGKTLELELLTRNQCLKPFHISEALHTYFAVSDIRQASILGLENCHYMDKVDDGARKQQDGAIQINAEVDRVYVDTSADCIIDDPGWQRKIRISKENSQSTIVWNPWLEKAEKMGDFGPEGYLGMVCVESGNALENTLEITAGSEHVLRVKYSVE
jgi:D-hexose-6-phosphate mutarotase